MAKSKAPAKYRPINKSLDNKPVETSETKAMIMPPGLGDECLPQAGTTVEEALGFVEPPPGLAPPPGLTSDEPASKADEEDVVDADFIDGGLKVLVTGLPNNVLSEPMVEAMLQQAGLIDSVVGFRVKPGKPCGKMTVTLTSLMAVEMCTQHFHGCIWDACGEAVNVRMVSDIQDLQKMAESCAQQALSAADPEFSPLGPIDSAASISTVAAGVAFAAEAILAAEAAAYVAETALAVAAGSMASASTLSADAKVFQPAWNGAGASLSADAPAFLPQQDPVTSPKAMSASAPTFVPASEPIFLSAADVSCGAASGASTTAGEKLASPAATVGSAVRNHSSETSTEVGDSDGEEEKDASAGLVA